MNLWESAKGMLQVELTSAQGAQALTVVNTRDIPVSRVEIADELTVTFWIRRQDWKNLRFLCEKRGDSLRILKKRGLYWTGLNALSRPILIIGLIFLMLLGAWLPTRVLFIRVEGNEQVPARRILYAAESCGVGFGASRKAVRSEKVKNALLGAIPELSWAGVNTSGCTAVISVRERQAAEETVDAGQSIIADRDGFILSADVTRGTSLYGPGQTVRKGQTLISGYSDCGICIRATGAAGEIFARTKRDLTAVTPANWAFRTGPETVRKKYSLLFRKKRIYFGKDSGIWDATCGRIYREHYITLPGGFQLPIALCVEERRSRDLTDGLLERTQAEEALSGFADRYLRQQMVSGDIGQKEESIFREADLYRLEGSYHCTEMIGRVQRIGETHGKRD